MGVLSSGRILRRKPSLRSKLIRSPVILLQKTLGIHHFSKHAFMVTLTFPIVSFGYFVADLWLL